MHGDAAHRDRLARIRAALGERDVERGGGGPGIIEKKLEKKAPPGEKQRGARLILEAPVLGHHRGWSVGAGHESDRSCFDRHAELVSASISLTARDRRNGP